MSNNPDEDIPAEDHVGAADAFRVSHVDVSTLHALLAGRLQPFQAQQIEMHLLECPACAQACDAISVGQDPLVAKLRVATPDKASASTPVQDATPPIRAQKPGTTNADETTFVPSDRVRINSDVISEMPQCFGRYRVECLLGRGGFGEVYRAWDDDLQRPVAIKVTFQRFLESHSKDQYLAEARTVARLDHPHIVPVLDVGQSEAGDFYVVSKLVEGTDLATRMRESRISWEHAISIATLIAEALHYAHGQGLVHRDVKPGNILLDTKGQAFLADFGIALSESQLGKGEGLAGTINYMSPEQARGEGHRVDGRSDIYSLGVVLYELLSGRRPFQSANPNDLLTLIAYNDVKPPRQIDDTIPLELEQVCLKALSRSLKDRYSTAKDFADALRTVVAARRAEAPQQKDSPGRKLLHWTASFQSIGCSVTLALGLVLAVTGGRWAIDRFIVQEVSMVSDRDADGLSEVWNNAGITSSDVPEIRPERVHDGVPISTGSETGLADNEEPEAGIPMGSEAALPEDDGSGRLWNVPGSGQAITKGSFTIFTLPSNPTPGEVYSIVIEIRLPNDVQKFSVSDLTGQIKGSNGYTQKIPYDYRHPDAVGYPLQNNKLGVLDSSTVLDVVGNRVQIVVNIPGVAKMGRDEIRIRSRSLNEDHMLNLEYEPPP